MKSEKLYNFDSLIKKKMESAAAPVFKEAKWNKFHSVLQKEGLGKSSFLNSIGWNKLWIGLSCLISIAGVAFYMNHSALKVEKDSINSNQAMEQSAEENRLDRGVVDTLPVKSNSEAEMNSKEGKNQQGIDSKESMEMSNKNLVEAKEINPSIVRKNSKIKIHSNNRKLKIEKLIVDSEIRNRSSYVWKRKLNKETIVTSNFANKSSGELKLSDEALAALINLPIDSLKTNPLLVDSLSYKKIKIVENYIQKPELSDEFFYVGPTLSLGKGSYYLLDVSKNQSNLFTSVKDDLSNPSDLLESSLGLRIGKQYSKEYAVEARFIHSKLQSIQTSVSYSNYKDSSLREIYTYSYTGEKFQSQFLIKYFIYQNKFRINISPGLSLELPKEDKQKNYFQFEKYSPEGYFVRKEIISSYSFGIGVMGSLGVDYFLNERWFISLDALYYRSLSPVFKIKSDSYNPVNHYTKSLSYGMGINFIFNKKHKIK